MIWGIEKIVQGCCAGWVYHRARPDDFFDVIALVGQSVVGRSTANQASFVGKEQDDDPKHSHFFLVTLDPSINPETVTIVCLGISYDMPALVIHSPDKNQVGKPLDAYQKFAGDSQETPFSSFSSQKLEALCLFPLKGKSVLDLGCNEGFFCQYARFTGARRVLGIDSSELFITKAKVRAASNKALVKAGGLEFRCGSWWDLPDEKFDVIFLLSAIHYEPEQKKFLDMLAEHLEPDGVLVLECGVLPNLPSGRLKIRRSIDVCWFPSRNYLTQHLLSKFNAKYIRQSVAQGGDPVPRSIYHCHLKKQIVGVIRGNAGVGKTMLARIMGHHGFQISSSDEFFLMYAEVYKDFAPSTLFYQMIGNGVDRFCLNWARELINMTDSVEEFCREYADSLPLDGDVCFVEGDIFSDENIFQHFVKELESRNIVVWDVSRANLPPAELAAASAS